jgi:hypothetical protein
MCTGAFREQLLVFLDGALGTRRGELYARRWSDCNFDSELQSNGSFGQGVVDASGAEGCVGRAVQIAMA